MPIYEYKCLSLKCGKVFEKFRSVNFMDMAPECPECGRPSRRLLSSPNLQTNPGTKLRRKLDKKKPVIR